MTLLSRIIVVRNDLVCSKLTSSNKNPTRTVNWKFDHGFNLQVFVLEILKLECCEAFISPHYFDVHMTDYLSASPRKSNVLGPIKKSFNSESFIELNTIHV